MSRAAVPRSIQIPEPLVLMVGPEGGIRFASPGVERLLAIPGAELMGNSLLRIVIEEDQSQTVRLLTDVVFGQAPVRSLALRLRAASGTAIPLALWGERCTEPGGEAVVLLVGWPESEVSV